jgi:hypothetical protein
MAGPFKKDDEDAARYGHSIQSKDNHHEVLMPGWCFPLTDSFDIAKSEHG